MISSTTEEATPASPTSPSAVSTAIMPLLTTAAAAGTPPKKVLKALQALQAGSPSPSLHAEITPTLLGKVLYNEHGNVSTQLLGAMLGDHNPFFAALADEYPANFDFAGLGIVEAIRGYLWRFRLPGEAAQIERIIQGFARAFYSQQKQRSSSIATPAIPKSIAADAVGWYVDQPRNAETGAVCCAHCGSTETLKACTGCDVISFCRKCRYTASKRGHAVVGSCGYGRACIAARAKVGRGIFITGDPTGEHELIGRIEFPPGNSHLNTTADVRQPASAWPKRSPFINEDAVFVLAYSIIMLTTNLHNANVKEKMQLHQFLRQNAGTNANHNFPGDFLASIYKEVGAEAVQVMTA